jgi:signal transduction histidine kinase
MSDTSTVERLALLPSLTAVPRAQLEWLAAHGEVRRFDGDATLYSSEHPEGITIGPPATDTPGLVIVLSGRLSVRRVDRAGVDREVRTIVPGRVSGILPYSRLSPGRGNAAGYIVSDGPSEILLIGNAHIREMTRLCYDFTALCVHEMLDRARVFNSDDLQQEKMASLGRLSAGIAHELNNPSSAIGRSARELDSCRLDLAAAARALGAATLNDGELAAVTALERAAERRSDDALSPLARTDREDAVEAWLAAHGVDTGLTDRLAGTGVTIADLDAASAGLPGDRLAVALRYVAANATTGRLSIEINNAAVRIQSLVASVKKHTHMDRVPAIEPIRLDVHLNDTLTLVGSLAQSKGVALTLTVEPDVPAVWGRVGELNQVWLHLLDNAIDAAPEHGHVSVTAVRERGVVVVRVIDDGAGIADSDLPHIFDPFFTTKAVGHGVGLGLDIVQTLVRGHRGSIEVDSRPGRTEFRVCLPAGPAAPLSG